MGVIRQQKRQRGSIRQPLQLTGRSGDRGNRARFAVLHSEDSALRAIDSKESKRTAVWRPRGRTVFALRARVIAANLAPVYIANRNHIVTGTG